jgi:hypothetical protein
LRLEGEWRLVRRAVGVESDHRAAKPLQFFAELLDFKALLLGLRARFPGLLEHAIFGFCTSAVAAAPA